MLRIRCLFLLVTRLYQTDPYADAHSIKTRVLAPKLQRCVCMQWHSDEIYLKVIYLCNVRGHFYAITLVYSVLLPSEVSII